MENNQIRQMIEEGVKSFDANSEMYEVALRNQAKMHRMWLDALMAEGFTRAEAFQLILARGIGQ